MAIKAPTALETAVSVGHIRAEDDMVEEVASGVLTVMVCQLIGQRIQHRVQQRPARAATRAVEHEDSSRLLAALPR